MAILVVEDESELRETLVEVMHSVCTNVVSAENGEDGLEKFKKNKIALVLTDINMPKMNGIDLLKEIRKLGSEVPVIFITGYADKKNMVDAFRLGATDFVEKPFDIKDLVTLSMKTYELGLAILEAQEEVEKSLLSNPETFHKIQKKKSIQMQIRLMKVENQIYNTKEGSKK